MSVDITGYVILGVDVQNYLDDLKVTIVMILLINWKLIQKTMH